MQLECSPELIVIGIKGTHRFCSASIEVNIMRHMPSFQQINGGLSFSSTINKHLRFSKQTIGVVEVEVYL